MEVEIFTQARDVEHMKNLQLSAIYAISSELSVLSAVAKLIGQGSYPASCTSFHDILDSTRVDPGKEGTAVIPKGKAVCDGRIHTYFNYCS